MSVETAQFINNLNPALPTGASDPITEGDNHIRLIKGAILATFPAIAGQVAATHADLSSLLGAATTGANGLNVVTQAATNNGTLAASTAQVQGAIGLAIAPLAPLLSPVLTGTPTAPTATPGTATGQLATTAFAAALNIVGTAAATASAAASAGTASAAATSAALSAGAAIWVTGSTYAVNARVTSPSNGRVYMSLAAGVSNTEPASDTRWLLVTTNRPAIAIITATATAVSGTHYVMTNAAQSILTLPASPVTGSVVQVTFTNARTDNIIARNGSALLLDSAGNPLLEDMTVDVLNRSVILEYAFNTWRFYLDSTAVASSAVVATVTQATDAAATATTAATAATTARTAIDNKYRGALAVDPATRPDSTANQVGDEYFNTAVNLLKRFNGSIWLASDINTANLAASTGAGLVGFVQTGTGAVARTVQNKSREIVSVMDFGAIGDGVADDTTAIQTAVSSGKTVYFPDGNYLVATTINITTTGQKFNFDGTVIRAATMAANNYVFYATGIDNISFFTPKIVTPPTQAALVQLGGFIQLNNCNFVKVLNGSFVSRGVGGNPTLISHLSTPGCNDLLIQGNSFAYSYGNACSAQDGIGDGVRGKRVRILNNNFSENVDTSVGCFTNCSDVVIANNTFNRSTNSPYYQGVHIDMAGATDVVIANNIIIGSCFGIRIATNLAYTNNNILITKNVIKNQFIGPSDIGCGIRFAPNSAQNASIKVIGNEITVSNATCVGVDLVIAQSGRASIEFDRNTINAIAGACLRTQGIGSNCPVTWIAGNNAFIGTLATIVHEQQNSPANVIEMGAPVMQNTGVTLTSASPVKILSGFLQPGLYMIKASLGAVTGTGNCFYRMYDSSGTAVGLQYSAWDSTMANTTPPPVIWQHVLTAGYYYVNWNAFSNGAISYNILNAELVRVA